MLCVQRFACTRAACILKDRDREMAAHMTVFVTMLIMENTHAQMCKFYFGRINKLTWKLIFIDVFVLNELYLNPSLCPKRMVKFVNPRNNKIIFLQNAGV
jgi:hypothetical protein